MCDEASIFVAVQCWLHMSPVSGHHRRKAQVLVHRLLTEAPSDDQDSLDAVDCVVNVFPIPSLILHVTKALADPKMINTTLANELNIVRSFLTASHPEFITFLDARFYGALSEAVRRQFKTGKREASIAVNKTAAYLIEYVSWN